MCVPKFTPAFFGIVLILLLCLSLECNVEGKSKGKRVRPERQGKSRPKKIKPDKRKCEEVTENESIGRLRCKKKNSIYFINVTSSVDSCTNTTDNSCSGLQPKVITDSNSCYWKRSCFIAYNRRAPIVKTSNHNCIGKFPMSLFIQYSCIKEDLIFILHDNGTRQTKEHTSEKGMLVSHSDYPWHYRGDLIITLTLRSTSTTKNKLFVTVPTMDIDEPDDIANITDYTYNDNGENVNINATGMGKSAVITGKIDKDHAVTTIKFFTNNASATAQGFIVCYYWTEPEQDLSQEDICSKLKKKKRPSKPGRTNQPKKNRGRGRRKKGKKREKRERKTL
ncbi:uncharacterized protein LOC124290686 [Haliotis rubra]|uniref:uncharacterized protein LOC124290686 n=1 Tax=Haliotis rubra TaxID=36100 RepID=UPI001EE4F975|nr:uncharacterized protein LOC124290686 [Haliotis rubra]